MKSCKRCGAGTYRKGGICSTCKPIKQRSGTSAHWTPRQTLANLAAGNRPKERPVFESEPVAIAESPVGIPFDWRDFNFNKPLRSDMHDSRDKWQRQAISKSRAGRQ